MIKQELLGLFSGDIKISDRVAVFNIPSSLFYNNLNCEIKANTFFIKEEINDSVLDLNLDINNINKTFFINEFNNLDSVLDLNLDINNINKTFFINEFNN